MTESEPSSASPATTTAVEASSPQAATTYEYAWGAPPTTFDYFTERYYHQYRIDDCKKTPGNHVRLLQHSNGLCVVCVDPDHAALEALKRDPQLRIASIVFGSGRGNNQLSPENLNVVGKKKKNALICQVDTKLCTLTLSDGSAFALPACLNGFLLELNASLTASPWLVAAAPTAEGYLAIVNPSPKNDFSAMRKVWTATGGDAQGDDDE